MNDTSEESPNSLRAIASLITKSAKAIEKLPPETWQHSMLLENISALTLAYSLMEGNELDTSTKQHDQLLRSLGPIVSMKKKTDDALRKFKQGSSKFSLLRNRLNALEIAEQLIQSCLGK